ncbi:MAG: alkaline phosphatase [Candidatus Lokiarchaeota archaeon]|nr:alkaline phosphatase [Candidatus Lokiarchaeota archaeon]
MQKYRLKKIIVTLFISIMFSNFLNVNFNVRAEITPPTGIILFIGDGMGFQHIELARLVEYGPNGESAILSFPYQNDIATVNIDGMTTDSAASGTAISTGVKTRNGRIAMNYNGKIELTTILEIAQDNGYATGIVATCHLTHATPAVFMAHNPSRNNYLEIAEDIFNTGLDVLLGGGSSASYLGNYISAMEINGYNYITNKTELNCSDTEPLLGLFSSSSLTPVHLKNQTNSEPSLLTMTQKAIELLNNTGKPFFLMVEGSQIDWGSHDNDPIYTALETIEFEKSVNYAKDLAENDSNLLLLVTADHETGGLTVEEYDFLTPLPLDTDNFETKKNKRLDRVGEITTSWSTGGHTSKNVILTGMGPNSERILNATHHINTFSIMRELIDGETDPFETNTTKGHVNLFVIIFLGILGVSAVIGGLSAWKHTKKSI